MTADTRTSIATRTGDAYKRFFGIACATAVLLALVGYMPTRQVAGEEAVASMFLAIAVALLASIAGTLPIYWARHLTPLEAMPAQFGAMAVRLVTTLLLGIASSFSGLVMVTPFLLWLVLAHTGFLVADTLFARAMVNVDADGKSPRALPQQ